MADLIRYGKSKQAELYLEDNSLIGIATSFKIPKIEWETIEHETLGQIAVLKTPGRKLNALEGSASFQFLEPEVMEKVYDPTHLHKMQLHQFVDVSGPAGHDEENSHTLITIVDVRFHGVEMNETKSGDDAEISAEYTCSRLVQRLHSREETLLEVDVFANKVRNSSGAFWQ